MNEAICKLLERKGTDVHRIDPGAKVVDAVTRMNQAHVGALLVTDGERPIGILTERDVLVRVIAERRDPAIARCCVSHAAWDAPGVSAEELLVALADKLWKGKRVDEIERLVADAIVATTGHEPWAVFAALDAICGAIAADGDARLARSVV